MTFASRFAVLGLCASALASAACGGNNAASAIAKEPEYAPANQTKCGVKKSQARPLIVEWPSADRASLEAQAKQGLVVVRYEGCDMEVMRGCRVDGRYTYTPTTRQRDKLVIKSADELYANLPAGAARLEGKLAASGELNVAMTIVGSLEGTKASAARAELVGDCNGATHLVRSMTAGAFEFFAGADAEVSGGGTVLGAGAGGKSTAKRETLNEAGVAAACDAAKADDAAPPYNCGAILRLEVTPIGDAAPATADAGAGAGAARTVAQPGASSSTSAAVDTKTPPKPSFDLATIWKNEIGAMVLEASPGEPVQQLEEGQSFELPLTMAPNRCYGIFTVAASLNVSQTDIEVLATTGGKRQLLQKSKSTGGNAFLGGGNDCFQNMGSSPLPVTVVVRVRKGNGLVKASIYSRPAK